MSDSNNHVEAWMVSYLADLLDVPADEVSRTTPFESFGLDSAAIVVMTSDLSKYIGMDLKSDLFFKYPDIKSVSEYLGATQLKRAG
ncbi:MAG: acyl carrier protein [Proteobacteria bacterium]|nr:acyl carrier protein [Pseudomonadota bacterium]